MKKKTKKTWKVALNCRNYLWTLRRFWRHQSEKEIENPNCYLFRKFFACRLHSWHRFLKITFNCTLTAEARATFPAGRTKSFNPTPLALFRCWYVILVFETELREPVAIKRVYNSFDDVELCWERVSSFMWLQFTLRGYFPNKNLIKFFNHFYFFL